jgi:hypothetical protein
MQNPSSRLITVLFLSVLSLTIVNAQGRKFTIDQTDAFKIVMFSNLYIDDDAINYAYTMQLVQNVIDAESPVDLVILAGDTVDPRFEESYTNRFEEAVAYFKIRGIPWVSTGGEDRPEYATTRDYMFKKDQQIGADEDLSYTGRYNPG